MLNKLKPKSEFSRNVLTLMTGTTIAQAIPIAISPILTRIYSPADYGVYALYISIITIISVIATGRYELAILLPKKEEDATNIAYLSITITLFISFVTFFIVFFFNADITALLKNQQISNWLYLIPFSVLVNGIYVNLSYIYNRKKEYKTLAANRVIQSGGINSLNLTLGFTGLKHSGLIISTFLGQLGAMLLLIKKIFKKEGATLAKINKAKQIKLAKKYINFPKFDILATLAVVITQQGINIFFNTLYNATTAGHYYFTQRIMGMPVTFIAAAILDVFKEQASKDYNQYGNAKTIYISTFKKLFILSFIPSILIYLYAADLFAFVFGEEWRVAGEYARILTPMLFLRFISSPLSFMFYIGEKQLLNLCCQFLLLSSIFLSFYGSNTAKEAVVYITISFCVFYLLQLIVSSNIAGVFSKCKHN